MAPPKRGLRGLRGEVWWRRAPPGEEEVECLWKLYPYEWLVEEDLGDALPSPSTHAIWILFGGGRKRVFEIFIEKF